MSRDRQQYRVELDAGTPRSSERVERDPMPPTPDTPFSILVLGDFSGRANTGRLETGRALGRRPAVPVDRDTVDDVLRRFAPALRIPLADGDAADVRFEALEDFHPDRLLERVPRIRALRERRDQAAAPTPIVSAAQRPSAGRRPAAGLLDQILGDAPMPPGGASSASARSEPAHETRGDPLSAFVRRAVTPHLVPETRPADPAGVAELDESITNTLRALLHHGDFQALEANWRAVDLLVRRLETDSSLRVSVVDVSKGELAADLEENRALEDTGAFRLLVESSVGTPGAAPWALLVGLYAFGADPADVTLLARLAALARQAGAPWVAAAHPSVVGSPSFGTAPEADDWHVGASPEFDALRRSADARFIALALPRFLLRLPYGADGEPCELSKFEELTVPGAHDDYLWGNSAVLVALLHGEAFTTDGWALRPRLEVSRLPLHLARVGGDVTAKPTAEIVLTERATRRILDRGPMPLESLKNGDSARFARHQSIAEPLAAIAGRWRPIHDAGS